MGFVEGRYASVWPGVETSLLQRLTWVQVSPGNSAPDDSFSGCAGRRPG